MPAEQSRKKIRLRTGNGQTKLRALNFRRISFYFRVGSCKHLTKGLGGLCTTLGTSNRRLRVRWATVAVGDLVQQAYRWVERPTLVFRLEIMLHRLAK